MKNCVKHVRRHGLTSKHFMRSAENHIQPTSKRKGKDEMRDNDDGYIFPEEIRKKILEESKAENGDFRMYEFLKLIKEYKKQKKPNQ